MAAWCSAACQIKPQEEEVEEQWSICMQFWLVGVVVFFSFPFLKMPGTGEIKIVCSTGCLSFHTTVEQCSAPHSLKLSGYWFEPQMLILPSFPSLFFQILIYHGNLLARVF